MSKSLDDLLRGGGIPPLPDGATDDASWDEHADSVMARVRGTAIEPTKDELPRAELDALLNAPVLAPEPGEPTQTTSHPVRDAGVVTMSDSDRPKSEGPVSGAGVSGPPSMGRSARQPRPSLKELAERMSKTPPPSSVAPSSVAPPAGPSSGRISAPAPARPSSPPVSAAPSSLVAAAAAVASKPASSAPPPPAPKSSTPESTPPASVPPATKKSDAGSSLAPVVPIESAKREEKPAVAATEAPSGNSYTGLIIAGLGIAAAAGLFFFLRAKDPTPAPAPVAATTTEDTAPVRTAQPETTAVETAKAEVTAAPTAEPVKDDSTSIDDLAEASSSASAAPVTTVAGGGPLGSALARNDDKDKGKDPAKPFVPNPDGTLDDAMRDAAGNPIKKDGQPEPASEPSGPKNVPDKPPQGSISAYVGSVMGRAKACVAGADDNSSANVTFASNGSVQKVSVGGWAAGKPAASCIEAALKGGKVEAFSKPTYGFSVTIRP